MDNEDPFEVICDMVELSDSLDLGIKRQLTTTKPLTHTEDGVPIRKLYISCLPKKVQKPVLLEIFSKYGPIEDITIRTISNSNKPPYAFVTYFKNEHAVKALSDKRHITIAWRKLRVSPADTWHQPDAGTVVTQDLCTSDDSKEPSKEDTTTMTIDILNDDCMLHILGLLSLRERIAVERVSKRWNSLCQTLWSTQRTLNINSFSVGTWDFVLTTQRLRSLLLRCGHTLTKLDISTKSSNLNIRTFQIIGKYCSGIQILNASGLTVTPHGTKALAQCCKNLRELHLEHCPGLTDEELKRILMQNKYLEVVNVARNSKVNGLCLNHLPKDIRSLNLMQCNNLEGVQLVAILPKFKKLTDLNLDSCVTLRNYIVRDIIRSTPQLTHLTLSSYMPLVTPEGLVEIGTLANLTHLNLRFSHSVRDETLESIAAGCRNLEVLDLTCTCARNEIGNIELSNEGLGALADLPKLHTIHMSYLMVGDIVLELLANTGKLIKLECRGCRDIGDRGCQAVLERCQNLISLDVSGCMNVSNKIIKIAAEQIEKRNNNECLKLAIGGTSADATRIPKDLSNLLSISFVDWSVEHLRPDYRDDFLGYNEEYLQEEWIGSNEELDDWELYSIDEDRYAVYAWSDDDQDSDLDVFSWDC